MKLKTHIEQKEIVKVESIKVTEKYSDALTRIRGIVAKELSIDGNDCDRLHHTTCSVCALGSSLSPLGHQCIATRIDDIFEDTIAKCKQKDI